MADSLFVMPFGKHKGLGIEDVPTSYLQWLTEQDFFCDEHRQGLDAVNKELNFRERFSDGDEPEEDRNWNRRTRR